jgi:hypothetical protein
MICPQKLDKKLLGQIGITPVSYFFLSFSCFVITKAALKPASIANIIVLITIFREKVQVLSIKKRLNTDIIQNITKK